jgi:hypothetical protein
VGALDGITSSAVAAFEFSALKMLFESYLLRHNAIVYNRITYQPFNPAEYALFIGVLRRKILGNPGAKSCITPGVRGQKRP